MPRSVLAVLLLLTTFGTNARAQDRIEVTWSDLAGTLDGRKVTTVLVDGTMLRGHVLDVSPTEARFDVSKTSDPNAYPKGERTIPKSQLTTLSFREMRRTLWQPLGTAIGAGLGALVTLPFWATASGEGGLKGDNAAITAAGIGGVAAAGYLLGRESDKRTVTVVVTTP